MLRHFKKPLVMAIFGCWIIGFAFQVGRASQHQEDRKQITAREVSKATNGQNPSSDGVEISFLGIKLGEALLALATAWLVLVTRDLVTGAADTAERQLRAYIAVRKVRITDVEVNKRPQAKFIIRNAGLTPAYDMMGMKAVSYGPFPPRNFPPPPPLKGRATVALNPRQEVGVNAVFHKVRSDRRLAAGLLIFSIAFCALVFHAGFKEMWASGKCDLNGGTRCSSVASSSRASPWAVRNLPLPFVGV